jgi:plasmid stability protein
MLQIATSCAKIYTIALQSQKESHMAILHVRNIPDSLYERLRIQAETQHRSLSAEVITILQNALERPRRIPAEILASISRRRYFQPNVIGAPDSTTLMRQDRER